MKSLLKSSETSEVSSEIHVMNVENHLLQVGVGSIPIAQPSDTLTPKLGSAKGIGSSLDANWRQAIAPLSKAEIIPENGILPQALGTRQSHFTIADQLPAAHTSKLLSKTETNVVVGDLKDDLLTHKNGDRPAIKSSTTPIRLQAESFTLNRYRIESNPIASGKKLISLVGGSSNESGKATAKFKGAAGKYNIVLGYFDENDGRATVTTRVGGKAIATTPFTQNLGSNHISGSNFVRRTVASGISLKTGTTIELLGKESKGEYARVDYIEFKPVGTLPPPPPPPPIDSQKPTATLAANGVSTEGSVSQTFSITYTDNVAIQAATLDSNDVRVTGSNGFSQMATLLGVDNSGNGSPRTATYRINAPGGSWDAADNGSYTVSVLDSQVSDTSGNSIAGGNLGTFQVNVADKASNIKLYFEDDFTNTYSTRWRRESAKNDYAIQTVSAPDGSQAVRFELHKTDPDVALSRRSELTLGSLPLGAEQWYGFRIMLPTDYKTDSSYEVVGQWHDVPDWSLGENWRSPPLAIFTRDGNWRVNNRWDSRAKMPDNHPEGQATLWSGAYQTGVWTDWVFRVNWSHAADGLLQVWKDGHLVVDKQGANMYNDQVAPYFKIGVYKPEWKENPSASSVDKRVLYFDQVRIGTGNAGYNAVVPR